MVAAWSVLCTEGEKQTVAQLAEITNRLETSRGYIFPDNAVTCRGRSSRVVADSSCPRPGWIARLAPVLGHRTYSRRKVDTVTSNSRFASSHERHEAECVIESGARVHNQPGCKNATVAY